MIFRHEPEDVEKAREMVRKCPTDCFTVLDPESGRVSYRNDSTKEIPTEFTEEHVEIAHHVFPKWGEDHIVLDRHNTGRFRVYLVKRKLG